MTDHSNGYLPKVFELLERVEAEQYENIRAAARLMASAIQKDQLIHVYGGGGHTTLPVGEMFFRAGGLCNIDPCMETGLSVFNQAQKYLALERCENYGRAIMSYYDIQPGEVLLLFHNIGTNAATIDAALAARERGAVIVAISSAAWQQGLPAGYPLRHSSGKNLNDLADVCIDDYNPLGDTVVELPGFDTPIGPISNIVDFYIAHRLEIECAKECLARGVQPPFWHSANVPGGDEANRKYLERYSPRIKML
ncbi:sugar isomerase domain-containing protein [Allofournierella sp.]|uniref:sugar isomerase domain-containing protein n=1 Tax=Allofournierella sp. TaxID=1940256 RepID=UPI003AB676C2